MGNDKITLDSISRADLHNLVNDLQKRVDELEARADGTQSIVENILLKRVDELEAKVNTQGDAILILAKKAGGE